VKLTCALARDLDEAMKEVKLLGELEEVSSQKIMELEALCKRLREDAQKLKEEKTTMEGMVESRNELIMEMAEEYGLNRWERTTTTRMRMMMMKGTPPHLLHLLHSLLHLR
jgi:hypothetical protein